ncbi:hypothetical protein P3T76_006203 [Phytophthora citrophthora]|uniref:CBM1 domain-containing protein n=1 Tax=Phytophthora citrophthora TaxID=4793 RepID=A0AAD9GPQ6_9STRA|nr:hypothetical protein P3T76_006203 [Phytophthora citrophthora]
MASLRFVSIFTLILLLASTVQASNLRSSYQNQSPPGSSDKSSDDITQDSNTSTPSDAHSGASGAEQHNVIEAQSSVKDTSAGGPGVKAWAQCGGLYYLGETKCQQHTFCKKLSEFISVCFPESRPTEKVMRLEL